MYKLHIGPGRIGCHAVLHASDSETLVLLLHWNRFGSLTKQVIVGHNGSGKTVSDHGQQCTMHWLKTVVTDYHRMLEVCNHGRSTTEHQRRCFCA